MSDHEIHFGDVEETQRLMRLRPDCNKQLAVVACGSPNSEDLPIFVDLDTMREMETHAQSDTRVELGGVMLGGQFQDDSEQPYVVVQDSLRARHFESSKGSFKFTHDTWSDITRRRDEFPGELQMVGWYHTHPDWGIFLSGMDMFICDHFFNRALDVALVIDPCRDDRGWFQWSDDSEQRVRQTGGFYLIASRHRRAELEMYAAQLEGNFAMSMDPRTGGPAYPGVAQPVHVTNVPDPRGAWQSVGVMGMLTMQFLVLVMIAWRLLFDPTPAVVDNGRTATQQTVDALQSGDRAAEQVRQAQRVEAQMEMLDRVVEAMDGDAPKNLVQSLESQRRENERLLADVRAYQALEVKLNADNRTLSRELEKSQQLETRLRSQLQTLDGALAEAKEREAGYRANIDELKEDLKGVAAGDAVGKADASGTWPGAWWMWAGGGALVVIVIAAGYALTIAQPGRREMFADAEDEPGPSDMSTGGAADVGGEDRET
jgi:proteasome lid subunit RPN8/RPN11